MRHSEPRRHGGRHHHERVTSRLRPVVVMLAIVGLVTPAIADAAPQEGRVQPQLRPRLELRPEQIAALRDVATSDVAEIDAMLDELQETLTGPRFMKAGVEERLEMLSRFYALDSESMFFGPMSAPVVHGGKAHLENVGVNFDWFTRQGYTYRLVVPEREIQVVGDLGAVIAVSEWTFVSPQGVPVGRIDGRSTLLLEKVGDRWLITHEHGSNYSEAEPQAVPFERLRAAVERLGR